MLERLDLVFTAAGLSVWWFVIIMLALGNFKDKEGRPIVTPEEGKRQNLGNSPFYLFAILGFTGLWLVRFFRNVSLTLGGIGIWALIDLISMAGQFQG